MTNYIIDPIARDAVTRRETGVRDHLRERDVQRPGDRIRPALHGAWWSSMLRHTWSAATSWRVIWTSLWRPIS